MNKRFFIFLCFIILALGLLDINIIPFYKKLGLDFSNQYGFHHCASSSDSIYKIEVLLCQDFENRPYVYPPTLYYLFSWTRLFSSPMSAYYFYFLISCLIFASTIKIWSEKKILNIAFCLGIFFSFPNLFLLERGNCDLLIVFFWSLAYHFYNENHAKTAGFFLALSIFSKLYPIYAVIPLLCFFIFNRENKLQIMKSLIGFSSLIILLTPFLWFEYLIDALPKWSSARLPILNLAHSLKSLAFGGNILFYFSLVTWIYFAIKSSKKQLPLFWTGALAISTFNNGVSFDYNLVTTFPLLFVLFGIVKEKKSFLLNIIFLFLLLTILGPRSLFTNFELYPTIRLILMAALLGVIPLFFIPIHHDCLGLLSKIRYQISKFKKTICE